MNSFRIALCLLLVFAGRLINAQEQTNHGLPSYSVYGTGFQTGTAGFATKHVVHDGFTCQSSRHLQTLADYPPSRLNSGPDTLWTRYMGEIYRDECYSVQQTSDSGYISVGRSCVDGAYDYQAWLVKTDNAGSVVWSKTFGDTYVDEAYKVRQTADGGFIIAGMSTSFGWAGEGWLIRTDNKGTILWSRGYHPAEGSVMSGWDYIYDVVETADGGFVFAGNTPDTYMSTQAWIGKVNSNGDLLWEHKYGLEYWERIFALEATSDGGFIGAGDRHWTHDNLFYKHDGWLLKFNAQGDTTWTSRFGDNEHDIFRSVQQTSEGGYIVCGERELSTSSGFLGWLVRTDSLGTEVWSKTLAKGGFNGVIQESDQGFLAAGIIVTQEAACEGWLMKTSEKGDLIWEENIHGTEMDDCFLAVNHAFDGGVILGGKYNMAGDACDYWLVKTKAEELQGLTYFFENFDSVTPPAFPENWSGLVDVMIPNTVAEIRTIEQGSTTSLPNDVFIMNGLNGSNGQPDTTAFVALITPYACVGSEGATLSFMAAGTVPVQVGTITDPADKNTFTMLQEFPLVADFTEYTVTLAEPGNTYLAIKHSNTIQVNPVFVDDILFQQINTTNIHDKELPALNIYPNPADSHLIIESAEAIRLVELFNLSGNKVFSQAYTGIRRADIPVSLLASGYYLAQVTTVNGTLITNKFVIAR